MFFPNPFWGRSISWLFSFQSSLKVWRHYKLSYYKYTYCVNVVVQPWCLPALIMLCIFRGPLQPLLLTCILKEVLLTKLTLEVLKVPCPLKWSFNAGIQVILGSMWKIWMSQLMEIKQPWQGEGSAVSLSHGVKTSSQ